MESAPAQLWRQSRRGQLLFRVAIGAWVGLLEVLLADDYGDSLAPKLTSSHPESPPSLSRATENPSASYHSAVTAAPSRSMSQTLPDR